MLNSKEVLERTGISRATLNNYISCGLVPKPDVLPPQPADGAAPRIGYFADDVVARIEQIQSLKREGWSITRITEHFGGTSTPAAARGEFVAQPLAQPSTYGAQGPQGAQHASPSLTFGDIIEPAYLVDNHFQVVWLNDAAGGERAAIPVPGGAQTQNVFRFLIQGARNHPAADAILRLHIGLARQSGATLADVRLGVAEQHVQAIEDLYRSADSFHLPMVVRARVSAPAAAQPLFLYALTLREGTLFVYLRGESEFHGPLTAQPELPIVAHQAQRDPALTPVAVVVCSLENGARLWSELPPEEYFELINDIWLALDPIFRRHHGTQGKHPREGMVCHFVPRSDSNYLWNAVASAHAVREAMRGLSRAWQERKGWPSELAMNTGIVEGQEWLGTLRPGAHAEFSAQGDAVAQAAQLSDVSRAGAVWVTRQLLGKLSPAERERLKYGVWRKDRQGRDAFIARMFSRVENIVDAEGANGLQFAAIARLPVTELVHVIADSGASTGGAFAQPSE